VIAIERRADDGLLESVKGVQIINLGGAPVQSEITAGPVVDPVVAERPADRIDQVVVRLMQQIEKIAETGRPRRSCAPR